MSKSTAFEILFVAGTTAAGKSDIALHLARQIKASILVMDSMQVYRGANIGTSKPSAAEQQEIPHGGIDLAAIGEPFDVASYLDHAAAFLEDCRRQDRPVVVVGGTGLYFRALTRGLCDAPPPAPELRAELERLTLEELQVRLEKVDPSIIPHLDFKNPRRLSRAIEVMESTGMSLRDWQQSNKPPLAPNFRAFFIEREKDDLHGRIEQRVDRMLDSGWREEVRTLLEKHGVEVLRRFPAIGYPEIAAWLQSGGDFAPVRQAIALATRQYAKRQLTWFRRESNLSLVKMAKNDPPAATAERLL